MRITSVPKDGSEEAKRCRDGSLPFPWAQGNVLQSGNRSLFLKLSHASSASHAADSFSMAGLYVCLAHIIRLFEIEYQDYGYVVPHPCIHGPAEKWLG